MASFFTLQLDGKETKLHIDWVLPGKNKGQYSFYFEGQEENKIVVDAIKEAEKIWSLLYLFLRQNKYLVPNSFEAYLDTPA